MRLYVALCVLFYVASCQHCPFITEKGCACSISSSSTNATCGKEYQGKLLPAYDSSGNTTTVIKISISNTKVEEVREYEFVSWSTDLQGLYLAHNHISKLSVRAFFTSVKDTNTTLPALVELDLRYNKLTSVEAATFDSLRSLQILRLSYNQIKALDRAVTVNMNTLLRFSVQFNKLSRLPDKFIPATLQFLYIKNNEIRRLTRMNFYGAKSLKYLSFSHYRTRVDPDAFKHRDKLDKIHVESKPALKCSCHLLWYKKTHLSRPLRCNGNKDIKKYLSAKHCGDSSDATTISNNILLLLIPGLLSFLYL